MNSKAIKTVLKKRINNWIDTIEDESVKKLAEENTIVTGGSLVSLLRNEAVNDFDVYFRNKETVKAIAEYYVKKFKENPVGKFKTGQDLDISVLEEGERIKIRIKSAGIAGEGSSEDYQYFEDPILPPEEAAVYVGNAIEVLKEDGEDKEEKRYRPVFLSSNAITLSDKIQLIIRFYGEPEKIHENYDFVHCTCSWDIKSGELRLPEKALESILTKHIHYIGSKYPLCSVIRLRKFIKNGWYINGGQLLKICFQINELDLKDLEVLEDQLTGVDTAYFLQITSILKEKQDKDSSFKIDQAYICELIDRIF